MAPKTKEELRQMGEISDEYAKGIADHPLPVTEALADIFEFRKARADKLAGLRSLYPIPGEVPEVQETRSTVRMRDGYETPIKIYAPRKQPAEGSPLVAMFHEGGFCMGDLTDEDLNSRMFARDLGAVCVNVDYRLAPVHPFPTQINDCWDTLKWLAANAQSISANPRIGFIVGGSSAGGNLSAVLALLARDEKLDPPLTGQYLSVPVTFPVGPLPEEFKEEHLSKENDHDPVLKGSTLPDLADVLQHDDNSWLFAPILHPQGHAGVAPAYLQVCGMDPLRDDGLVYERVLREKYSVPTRLDLYPGFGHMFWTNYPQMERSRQYVGDTLEGFKWLLKQS